MAARQLREPFAGRPRSTSGPVRVANTPAIPQPAYTSRAAEADTPKSRIASTLNAHHTELPAPMTTADASSGPDRGQTNQPTRSATARADA